MNTILKEKDVYPMYHFFEIKNYHKLLMMTDGAMNMYPNVDEKTRNYRKCCKCFS